MNKEHEYIREYFYGPIFEKTLLIPISKTSITPNQLTISTFFLSSLIAVFILANSTATFILAGITLIIRNGIDCLDGLLARHKNIYSEYGHKLDTISDKFFEITMSCSILYHVFDQTKVLNMYFLSLCVLFFIGLLLRITSKHTKNYLNNLPPMRQQTLAVLFKPLSLATRSILLRTTLVAVALFINQLELGFILYLCVNIATGLKESIPYREWWIVT